MSPGGDVCHTPFLFPSVELGVMASHVGSGTSLKQRLRQPTSDRLVKLSKREDELLREFKSVLDTLKSQMIRVKIDGVKDNVDKLTSLFNFFNKVWDEGCAEWWVD